MPDEYFQSSLTAQQIETVLTQNQNSVLYTSQTLTDQQKNIARNNIGAYSKPSDGISKSDLSNTAIAGQNNFGVCSTAADTSTKVVTINSSIITSLTDGLCIRVKFANGSSSTAASGSMGLNLNGLGARGIDNNFTCPAGAVIDFVYSTSSGGWLLVSSYQKPVNGIPKSDLALSAIEGLNNYGVCSTAADSLYKEVTINSDKITSLEYGLCIRVRFTYGSTAVNSGSNYLQLNLNGLGSHLLANRFQCAAGDCCDFVYVSPGWWYPVGDSRKPSINGVTLIGNKTSSDLGLYSKPSGGIPSSDLASAVQTSLGKADTAYQKPSGGILGTDLGFSAIVGQNNFGVCSSNADDPYKVVTINSGKITSTSLTDGLCIRVKFTNGSSSTAASGSMGLNLNGLGNHVFAEEFMCESGAIIDFVYSTASGGQWIAVSDPSAYRKPSNGIPKTDLALDAIACQNNFGVCSTAADSLYKEVTINSDKITSLEYGLCIRVRFTYGSTAVNSGSNYLQLNLNGLGSHLLANRFQCAAGDCCDFVYVSPGWWYPVGDSRKPSINGVTLIGNKTSSDLGLYSKPSGGIPSSDLAFTAYQKPSGGIPKTDLASAVQTSLGKADTAYQKPSGGIPSSDLAFTAYQKPSNGIPISDLASAVIVGQNNFGVCSTAADSQVKEVTINSEKITSLTNGLCIRVLFSNGSTATGSGSYGLQINLNGLGNHLFAEEFTCSSGECLDFVYYANELMWHLVGRSSGGSGGTSNYSDLTNKPSINSVTLDGNKTTSQLGLYSKPSGGIPKTDLVSAVQTSLGKADTAYQKPSGGIPDSDLTSAVQTSLGKADTAYQKPSSGIPDSDLTSAVQTSLGKADTAYQKPSGGIPSSDLAFTAYQKPSSGIPKIDLASAVQTSLNKADTATIPSGGSAGQVLKKNSSTDYDVFWANESGGGSGGGGTSNYSDLTNKPQINGVTLSGNRTTQQLGLNPAVNVLLGCDNNYDYQDSPSGTFTIMDPDGTQSMDGIASAYRENFIPKLFYGDFWTLYEVYDLVRAETDFDNQITTLIFRTISYRNNDIVLKTVTAVGYSYDDLIDATVTYTEATIGAAPSANGVSF